MIPNPLLQLKIRISLQKINFMPENPDFKSNLKVLLPQEL